MKELPQAGQGVLLRSLLSLRRRGRADLDRTLGAGYLAPPAELAAHEVYARALGFDPALGVPLTYLYLLGQRAHLHLMLGPDFPYPLAGMVHAAERLQRLGPIEVGADLAIEVELRPDPPTRSGARLLTLDTVFLQRDQPVAQTQSRYLARRGGGSGKPSAGGAKVDPAPLPEIARYPLAADAGRRYARLSGDYNPIHLWPWTARLLGFRRPIIHGMHSLGRTLALLQQHQGGAIDQIDARFTAPLALPAEVVLHAEDGKFELRGGGKCAVSGSYVPGGEGGAAVPASVPPSMLISVPVR
jgi:acyl dehydratase